MDSDIRLTGLYTYPLKSARGIALTEAQLEARGLPHDRRWMLVDAQRQFLSQRQLPRLALVEVELQERGLRFQAPQMEPLEVLIPESGVLHSVQIWSDQCLARSAGKKAAEWFREFLEISCDLVYMPEETIRPVVPEYARAGDHVSFSDGFPLLLLSEASVADLNQRLAQAVSIHRFRPNLVVAGCAPLAEDQWRVIQIGEQRLHVVKPCSRCIITTVEQTTGERGVEPLRTLATYRKRDGKVYFGQNVLHEGLGRLNLGDQVFIHS